MQKIMIAGIGGASLGTELLKCLQMAGNYEVYGCDISRTAYGLYESGFAETFCVDKDDYVSGVIHACESRCVRWLIPGGEQPMVLLGCETDRLKRSGITLLGNTSAVIASFSDKDETFRLLQQEGIKIPLTRAISSPEDVEAVGLPCIVKPSTGSGGSASVFYAVTVDEAMIYAEFIRRSGSTPLAQEYIDDSEGEFTVGVLSLPDASIVGSIAMRRVLDAKLSVSYRGRGGLVSSGYSQGYIDTFPNICMQAEEIARAAVSRGPMNIQGRVRKGIFMPFEINPRFSASTYLRAMAGFNEVDILIQYFSTGALPDLKSVKSGWYLRSLTEKYISADLFK
ncbi:ATP-grasp domain-containing protein [Stutzerimonas kunmingensis]|uniref:ATP-grasp domain-containing protein n=1 Tax=Stutzerimonas kunmingensis TaxID=1211807 RepID=UPI0028ABDAF8|nr:ATP-grasp domain-containing protein [Stutzerimonas kunmingensis]